MRSAVFAILIAAGASPAFADMSECDQYASNIEMTDCAWKQYKAADQELNDTWQQAVASLKETADSIMPASDGKKWLNSLTDAQRAWATFKDDDCNGAVTYEWYGGTGAGLAVATCLYDHTVARTDDLRTRYLHN